VNFDYTIVGKRNYQRNKQLKKEEKGKKIRGKETIFFDGITARFLSTELDHQNNGAIWNEWKEKPCRMLRTHEEGGGQGRHSNRSQKGKQESAT